MEARPPRTLDTFEEVRTWAVPRWRLPFLTRGAVFAARPHFLHPFQSRAYIPGVNLTVECTRAMVGRVCPGGGGA